MLLTHSPLLGLFALGATAIGHNVGRGDHTIQNLRQKVSDHESDLSGGQMDWDRSENLSPERTNTNPGVIPS